MKINAEIIEHGLEGSVLLDVAATEEEIEAGIMKENNNSMLRVKAMSCAVLFLRSLATKIFGDDLPLFAGAWVMAIARVTAEELKNKDKRIICVERTGDTEGNE